MLGEGTLLLVTLIALVVALAASAAALSARRRLARVGRASTAGSGEDAPSARSPINLAEAQLMADAMGIGLVRVDAAGRIVMANEAGHRLLERSPDGLLGKTTMEAFIDHRIEELMAKARRGQPAQLELTSGGEPQLTLVVRARRVRDGGVWLVLEDVSELRRLQRIRAEFIDNLSHELRTPLSTIRLLTESLALEMERNELPPRVRESIRQIDVETGQLVQMVNELLDLAQIEQGGATLQLDEVDLGRVVEQVIERLRTYAERQGVRLRGELPASSAERTITGDEQRLIQLLLNLLHNAVKFSPDGGDVTLRLQPAENDVVVQVEDQGVGIPRQELERVFERFYKVDRARSREGGGTGLGLAIARHIAERHGGRIWAESEEGRGSRFFISLPRSGPRASDGALL